MKKKEVTTKSKCLAAKTTSTKPDSNKTKAIDKKKEKEKEKGKDKQPSTTESTITTSSDKKEKVVLDFKDILKPSLITTNQKVDELLYLELMKNINNKDDLKILAICRLILAQDKDNAKVRELHDIIYETVKDNYYSTGELVPNKEEPEMDKHMKLNKDGEYEYTYSDDEDEKE